MYVIYVSKLSPSICLFNVYTYDCICGTAGEMHLHTTHSPIQYCTIDHTKLITGFSVHGCVQEIGLFLH